MFRGRLTALTALILITAAGIITILMTGTPAAADKPTIAAEAAAPATTPALAAGLHSAAYSAAAHAAWRRQQHPPRHHRHKPKPPPQATPADAPAISGSPVGGGSTGGTPRQIAAAMLPGYGWNSTQFSCLDQLWTRESGWNPTAENPDGAYGIPQALPGSKMASAGPDWPTDAATQIRWGLGYIRDVYGTPCGAWSHEEATGWY